MINLQSDNYNALDALLHYHAEISPENFTQSVMSEIEKTNQLRNKILTAFVCVGVVMSLSLFFILVPANSISIMLIQNSQTLFGLIMLSFMGSCFWLLTSEN